MAKVTVKFQVKASSKNAYIVGSTDNLGAWDAKKALALTKADGVFTVAKQFEVGTTVEFKVLSGKAWTKVEKGANGEELANRSFVAAKGLVVAAEVVNFAK